MSRRPPSAPNITSTRRRHAIAVVAATVAMTAATMAFPAPSLASGALPSATTLTVTPKSSTAGTAVTLQATVKVLGLNGLGVTPTGSVTFTSTNGSATAQLGSAPLSACLLSQCTARLVTTTLPIGTKSVTASYPGDGLVGPSSGTAAATVAPNPAPGPSSTVVCYAGQPCDTGTVSTGQTHTSVDVSTPASSSTQALSASMAAGQLHCPPSGTPDGDGDDDDAAPFPGDVATFSSTAADVSKTVRYTGTGTVGTLMRHQYNEHTAYVGCYGSVTQFNGFTAGSYGPAPFNSADGLYEAQLPNCATHGGQRPCFTNSAGSGTTDSYVVQTLPGDPKYIG